MSLSEDAHLHAPIGGLERVAIYAPLALIPLGGLIGGVCGGIAVAANLGVSKTGLPAPVRYIGYVGTFGVAFGVSLAICLAVLAMLAGS